MLGGHGVSELSRANMYPPVTQFETRQLRLERELQSWPAGRPARRRRLARRRERFEALDGRAGAAHRSGL
jgi:hypothetical protein